ncbi:aspartate carbamoyltransferase catalytic subunit [Shimia biformata]|uniref:aspartate carbamoyltransferase catalytic subunit n=1 Tax=Shimia biformata TaxID=1294299 RepID=UPI00194FA2BC|nr:aspartate carbamoyltransferase catalytic subunit [Shimia biformata]
MSDPWQGLLDPGETILWQGRPEPGISCGAGNIMTSAFGLVFAGFALFWMIMASRAGGFFWMFGLIHFSVGIGLAFGPFLFGAYRRRHTWYTLTDRRGFVATDLPVVGKRLKSYPIDAGTVIDFLPGPPPSIHFAEEFRRTKNGRRRVPVGFERIADGTEVYKLMRGIQTGGTAPSAAETEE